uniref:Homing endonuclease LAGLIDADG domain-containing protein n=1 Tax=Microbotryum cf. violaceum BFL-2013 TaxID=1288119 RepID=M1GLD7_9BASI|nr:hypothetical protein H888_mgp16 [Microbotryum cf. violaceum BFL-2013]AGE14643.1 hypothetical protein [Microbotryum cf. violaceum BFL-2013]
MTLQSLRSLILQQRFLGKPLSPNSKIMKQYKELLPIELSSFQKAMLVGLMLGDVSLKWNKSLTGASLQFEWGDKHVAYAFYVWHLLYPYCLEVPRRQVRTNANGNEVVTWCFQTVTHPAFLFLHDVFIVEGKKCVLPVLYDLITPISLAFWFMDDGGRQDYRSYGLQFHTQGFTTSEVDWPARLCRAGKLLQDKFDLKCWRKSNKGRPIIAVSGHSYNTFFGLIKIICMNQCI